MRKMHYYATHNPLTDLARGVEGSPKGWKITRFHNTSERDAFVEKHDNQRGQAVTRIQANRIWRDTFLCRGEEPPVGGLFLQRREFEE